MGWWRRIFQAPVRFIKSGNLKALEKRIGYRFKNPLIGEKALRHRSLLAHNDLFPSEAYERLEFLGDAVLNLTVALHLYKSFPGSSEGELTKMKSVIVSGEVLSQRAEAMELGDYLLMGPGEVRSGGRKKPSILSGAFESLIGAIFLDGGLNPASNFIHKHLLEFATEICDSEDWKNYKSILLEFAQLNYSTQPQYNVTSESGPEHRKTYQVEVSLSGQILGQGQGSTKRRAEQRAAKSALDKLGVNYNL